MALSDLSCVTHVGRSGRTYGIRPDRYALLTVGIQSCSIVNLNGMTLTARRLYHGGVSEGEAP